jgi:hypothetical protein
MKFLELMGTVFRILIKIVLLGASFVVIFIYVITR